jgi:PhoPQ-activated pathogenicity-related protein
LATIIDPYSYRKTLTLPKLIVNGANDPYWATDAINNYWDGLTGPKALLAVPNSGHELQDIWRVINTSIAFFRTIAGGKRFPSPTWRYIRNSQSINASINSHPSPLGGRLWTATATTRDFRNALWTSTPAVIKDGQVIGSVALPVSGYLAVFGEVDYKTDKAAFTLSTAPRIYARSDSPR